MAKYYITTLSLYDIEEVFNEYNGDIKEFIRALNFGAIEHFENRFSVSIDDGTLVVEVDYGFYDHGTATFDIMFEKEDDG